LPHTEPSGSTRYSARSNRDAIGPFSDSGDASQAAPTAATAAPLLRCSLRVPESPTTRPYDPRDLEACRSLWAELTERHRELYADRSIGGRDPGRGFDEHLQRAERIWVADAGGAVVGLAGMLLDDGKAELEPIVVAAAWRRRGIGALLTDAVVAAARERGARQVVVRPTGRNAEAVRFFHALGFDVLGRVDLRLDLRPVPRRRGERIAGRDFRV
jgi:ribosomal protein S18 acetylase RimI-like enzyme